MKTARFSLVIAFISFTMWSPIAMSSWFADNMIDPEDGMMDASDYLASARGFLPIPVIITEPAVGFGLGVAVAIPVCGKRTTYATWVR